MHFHIFTHHSTTPSLQCSTLSSPRAPDEQSPSDEKSHATNRCDGAEPTHARQAQNVKAAGKNNDADNKSPTSRMRAGMRPTGRRPANREQRERVIHLIAHTGFEDLQQINGQTRSQPVRCKRPQGNAKEAHYCPTQKKEPLHHVRHQNFRDSRFAFRFWY